MSPQTGFTAILAVAFNTYREAVRSKVLYSILFFGLFIIGFAAILGELSLYQNERVIKDVGLFALSLFGNLMAIFLGVSFLYKEIERKSIYNIVSKPIHRWQYFIGKFAGIIGTLWLQLFFMLIVLTLVLFIWAQNVSVNLFIAFWAWALFFASKESVNRIEDRAWAERAEAICAPVKAELKRLETLADPDIQVRADLVDQSTDLLSQMLDDITATPPSDEKGQAIVPDWINDYRTLLQDRYNYAERLRAGNNVPFTETPVRNVPITERIDKFTIDNQMLSCSPPIAGVL